MPLPEVPVAECPRCGYDQSGVVASWESACPLRSLCTECALDIEWRDVLNPHVRGPDWSYEHGFRPSFRRALATFFRSLAPWILFRGLRIGHTIRLDRLFRYGLVALGATHAFFALFVIAFNDQKPLMGASAARFADPNAWMHWIAMAIWPYSANIEIDTRVLGWIQYQPGLMVVLFTTWTLMMPALLSIFSSAFVRARLRYRHIWRGFWLSVPPMAIGALVMALLPIPFEVMARRGGMGGGAGVRSPAIALGSAIILLWPVWLVLFWGCFIFRYARFYHAAAILLAMTLVSAFAGFVMQFSVAIFFG